MRFRKKPIVIEAIQMTLENSDKIRDWIPPEIFTSKFVGELSTVAAAIKTLEGTMIASEGDWIIKGVNGEFYPCKPDIFEKTYESVE